jgi:hypothetical protein
MEVSFAASRSVRRGSTHEVECSNPENGETIWLDTMYVDEIEPYST